MEEEKSDRTIWEGTPYGNRPRGSPRKRLSDVDEDTGYINARNRRT